MFESASYAQTTIASVDPWTATGDQWSETSAQSSETGLWNHSYTWKFPASQNNSKTHVASPAGKSGHLIFLISLCVFIVVGNLSVLLALGLSKRGKKSFRMTYFIMNLAFADLLVGLVSVLTDIIWKITLHWYAGNVMCKIVRYLQAVVTYASTYVLVALSIDRLDAIARPMNFSGGNVRAKVLIALAWLFACVFSIPMLVINKEKVLPQDGAVQCRIVFGGRWNWTLYMTLIAIVLFVIPALIITTCYLVIIYVIWTKSKLLGAPPVQSIRAPTTSSRLLWRRNTENDDVKGRQRTMTEVTSVSSAGVIPKAKIRTIKMTFLIVLIFILCWSPYFVFDLLDVYGLIPYGNVRLTISHFVQSLAPLNSAANPLIYGFFSSRLCQNLRRLPCFKTIDHRRCRHPHHHHPNHPLNQRRRCHACCCCCLHPQPSSSDRNASFCLSTYALPSTTSLDHVVSVGPTAGADPAAAGTFDRKDSLCLSGRTRVTTSIHRNQTCLDGTSSSTSSVIKKAQLNSILYRHNHQGPTAGGGSLV